MYTFYLWQWMIAFSDGCTNLVTPEFKDDSIKVVVDGKTKPNTVLMMLLALIEALQGTPVKSVNVHFEFTPYARGDKPYGGCRYSQLDLFFNTLYLKFKSQTQINCLSYSFEDIHNKQAMIDILQKYKSSDIEPVFLFDNLQNGLQYIQNEFKLVDFDVVSPDKGSLERVKYVVDIANEMDVFNIGNIVYFNKERDPLEFDVQVMYDRTEVIKNGLDNLKTAVIVDDIVDGGRTVIAIAKQLKTTMGYKKVVVLASHLILSSKPFERIGKYIDVIVPTKIVGNEVTNKQLTNFNYGVF